MLPVPSPPLILTLSFDPNDQARLESLRRAHFPPERNLIPAHLTLFHHLDGDQAGLVEAHLRTACASVAPFPVEVTGLRSLGRGVAFSLHAPALAALRGALARAWHDQLTPQDRQGWRPHVTIQNKAAPADAARLLGTLQATFAPFAVRAEGLRLWRYLGGPWELASVHPFTQAPPP